MVEKSLLFYGEAVEKLNEKKEREKRSSRAVELFFSFDIVNSSAYKDINYLGWQDVLTTLLTSIQRNITKDIPEAQLWRVLGDEIIFFVTIRNEEEIYNSIGSIYSVLVQENLKLHNGNLFKEIKNSTKSDVELLKHSNVLSIQAAAWLAIILNGEQEDFSPYDNIFKKYNINENQRINEFLGQDIDIGFRIKKETQDRRLVISVELAKLLSNRTEYLSRLNIITYKNLNGVWKNRLYPIIWYHDEEISGMTFEDSFYYDETSYSQLSKEYFLNRETEEGDLASYMFTDVHKALNKIIEDQNLDNKIKHIKQVIRETGNDVKAVEDEFEDALLEFHCAAVCCNLETRRVLIAKRGERSIYSGLWEFGCAKANTEKNLCESVVLEYKNDFGIDIEVICDNNRADKEPIPLALYQVNKVEKLQKGVIVVAKIIGNIESLEKTVGPGGKHQEYRWISEEEIEEFAEDAIDDFKDTLRKVFLGWDKFFEEK